MFLKSLKNTVMLNHKKFKKKRKEKKLSNAQKPKQNGPLGGSTGSWGRSAGSVGNVLDSCLLNLIPILNTSSGPFCFNTSQTADFQSWTYSAVMLFKAVFQVFNTSPLFAFFFFFLPMKWVSFCWHTVEKFFFFFLFFFSCSKINRVLFAFA